MIKERKSVTPESELAWELQRIEVVKRVIRVNTGTDDVRALIKSGKEFGHEIDDRIKKVFEIETNITRLRSELGITLQ